MNYIKKIPDNTKAQISLRNKWHPLSPSPILNMLHIMPKPNADVVSAYDMPDTMHTRLSMLRIMLEPEPNVDVVSM